MCHRYDGLCNCYYCTIFGHAVNCTTECNHGRANETRERLRKRLQIKESVPANVVKTTPRRKTSKVASPPSAAASTATTATTDDKGAICPDNKMPECLKKYPIPPPHPAAVASLGALLPSMLAVYDADIGAQYIPGTIPHTATLGASDSEGDTGASGDVGKSSGAVTTSGVGVKSGGENSCGAAGNSGDAIRGDGKSSGAASSIVGPSSKVGANCSVHNSGSSSSGGDTASANPSMPSPFSLAVGSPIREIMGTPNSRTATYPTHAVGPNKVDAPATGGSATGVKRKLLPPAVPHTQNVQVNGYAGGSTVGSGVAGGSSSGGGSAVAPAAPSAKKEAGICSLKDDQYRIKKILTKKAALAKAQQCAAKLTVPTSAAAASAAQQQQPAASISAPARSAAAPSGVKVAPNPSSTASTAVAFPPPPPVEPPVPADVSIEKLLEFIEGGSSTGGVNSAANKRDVQKKAAKKAKQKQRKQEDRQVEELERMRDEFHDLIYCESVAKVELRMHMKVSGKKKNKRRLAEAENLVRKLCKQRMNLETEILERIADMKANNSEFKFSYLPSKEQLLQMQLVKSQAHQAQVAASPRAPSSSGDSSTTNDEACVTPKKKASLSSLRTSGDGAVSNVVLIDGECEVISDPAKRMVTIRRVNVPYCDPQVTVTAKGPSPDKDKLLYTFVNGQLVEEPCKSDAATGAQPVSLAEVYHQQHEELVKLNSKRQSDVQSKTYGPTDDEPVPVAAASNDVFDAPNVKATSVSPTPATSAEVKPKAADKVKPLLLTGKAKKKAEKKARKAESAAKAAAYRDQRQQNAATRSGSVDETSSIATTVSTASKKTPAQSSGSGRKGGGTVDVDQLTAETKQMSIREDATAANDKPRETKESKRKQKSAKFEYADPEYRNNKFDVLDMDDDEYGASDSGSEHSYQSTPQPGKSKPANSKLLPLSPIEYTREVAFTTVRGSKSDKTKTKKTTTAKPAAAHPVVAAAAAAPPQPGPSTPGPSSSARQKAAPPQPQPAAAVWSPPSYMRPVPTPQPLEIQLSKKQQKKLAQQQARQQVNNNRGAVAAERPAAAKATPAPQQQRAASAAVVAKTVTTATGTGGSRSSSNSFVQPTETMAQKLKNSMQRLSINDDTTIELVREHAIAARIQQQQQAPNTSVSIIDQLQRGVQMEGLMLPPGITLTRVDPEQAEQIRVKKESIQKICQPMQAQAVDTMPSPHVLMPTGHLNGPLGRGQEASGIIMVDTARLHSDAHPTLQDANSGKKNSKKNRRYGKKTLKEEQQAASATATSVAGDPASASRLVTLRNPMFHQQQQLPQQSAANSGLLSTPMHAAQQSGASPSLPLSIDSPASITKNANGMFTIRNPAMHQALHQTMPPNMMKLPPPSPMLAASAAAAAAAAAPSPKNEFQPMPAYLQPPPMLPPMCVPPPNMLGSGFQTVSRQPPPVVQQQQSAASTTSSSQNMMASQENFSFFSDHNIIVPQALQPPQHQPQSQHAQLSPLSPGSPPRNPTNPTPAIGSEVKNALQRKQQQLAWQSQQQQLQQTPPPTLLGNAGSISRGASANGVANDMFSHLSNLAGQPSLFGRSSPAPSVSPFSHFSSQPQQQPLSTSIPPPSISRYFETDFNGPSFGADTSAIAGGGAVGGGSLIGGSSVFDSGLFGTQNGGPPSAASPSAHLHNQQQQHRMRQSPPVAVGQPVGSYFNRATFTQQPPQQSLGSDFGKSFDFLSNLQPGQRLNSEVTIHNVNESKFHRGGDSLDADALGNNGVEITRVPPPTSSAYQQHHLHHRQQQQQQQQHHHHLHQSPHRPLNVNNMHGQQQQQQPLQQSSHMPLYSQFSSQGAAALPPPSEAPSSSASRFNVGASGNVFPTGGASKYTPNEFADNGMFVPNAQVSLNDLDSDMDRDIESFKRFNYYFKPPATKPKVNFDVKNFVLANRKPTAPSLSDSSSPYYSETPTMNGGTASMDDLYNDLSLLQLGAQLNGGVSVEELGMLAGNVGAVGAMGLGAVGHGGGAGLGVFGASGGSVGGSVGGGVGNSRPASGDVGTRADSFIHGLIDGSELKSGLVD